MSFRYSYAQRLSSNQDVLKVFPNAPFELVCKALPLDIYEVCLKAGYMVAGPQVKPFLRFVDSKLLELVGLFSGLLEG